MKFKDKLSSNIKNLVNEPGVYLFKNSDGNVVYIGKARSLKNRVKSYFSYNNKDPKTMELISAVADIETIQTGNELEALILESNLIKRYQPRFNVNLRDDKHYPFLQLTVNETYPRLRVVRKIRKDGSLYYGPYVPVRAMRNTIRLINKYFKLRQCSRNLEKISKRPCLNFQIGRCIGPCYYRNKTDYWNMVNQVKMFLEGKENPLTKILKKEMEQASGDLDFEKAAMIRDQIRDIKQMLSKQNIISSQMDELDVVGYVRDGSYFTVDVFHVRTGRILGRHSHRLNISAPTSDQDALQDFITQYYLKDTYLPNQVVVPLRLPDVSVIENWFTDRKGRKVSIHYPVRGRKKELLKMVMKNAKVSHMVRIQELAQVEKNLEEMKGELKLLKLPGKIEAFDISNIGGVLAVGSMVTWENNHMCKSGYRRFKIKNVNQIDDYSMMAEIVRRRYTRVLRESLPFPDLVLIDGGLGHVNTVAKVMNDLNLGDIEIIGIAKGRYLENNLKDRIFKPGVKSPIILPTNSQTLHILQQIRDEAHRFAITFHKRIRQKQGMHSILDDVPGIGPKRKKIVLKHFGSLKKLKSAGLDELKMIKGLNDKTAVSLYMFFHPGTKSLN